MPDNAIWAVTGPEHDARMARELAWIATGGQTGIVGPESLEVLAQNTPNNTVRIMPGGFSIAATSQSAAIGYTSAPWQSYMRAVYQPIDVEIDATGSSGGRTDVVGIVVDDPEFEGTSPDPDAHQYWRPHVVKNAGNNATRPEHFASLGRPFLPLAQVQIPSSTATITDSMTTDIRFMSVTRSERAPLIFQVSGGTEQRIPASQTAWMTIHTFSGIQVPQWARRFIVEMQVGPVYTFGGAANGNFRIRATDQTRAITSESTAFVEPDHNDQVGGSQRVYLHASMRRLISRATTPGGLLDLELQVRRTSPGNRPGELVIPSDSFNMSMAVGSVTFEETATRTTG